MFAVIAVKLASGEIKTIGGESTSAMLAAAREIRNSGIFDGRVAVKGAVLNDNGFNKSFRCNAPVVDKKKKKSE